MEDALLLHVSECHECLTAAVGHRSRLAESGCGAFQALAARLQISPGVAETLAIGEGHLQPDAIEEYVFGRLSKLERTAVETHLSRCNDCRSLLGEQREFIACLKHALNSWIAPLKTQNRETIVTMSSVKFPSDALIAAQEKLPVSRVAGLEALRLLQTENVSLERLDLALRADPVLSGHLIRVANSALLSYGQEARTVSQAVARIGVERTKLHVCGLAMKRMYSSPQLQKIWNHSVQAAQISRQLASMTHALSPDEASLVALVHDIGHIVLSNLGQPYERARTQRLARGLLPVQIERELCGCTHAGDRGELARILAFSTRLGRSCAISPCSNGPREPFCGAALYRGELAR